MTLFEYVQEQRGYFYNYCNKVKYEPITTVFTDFTLLELTDTDEGTDVAGKIKELYNAIKDKYTEAGAVYAVDLTITLNLKMWYFFEAIYYNWETTNHIGKETAQQLQNLYYDLYTEYYNEAYKRLNEIDTDEAINYLNALE